MAILFAGAAVADKGKDESGHGKSRKDHHRKDDDHGRKERDRHDDDHGSYFHRHGHTKLNIPKGHYPSPGVCRIWYPDRPAGQQPPPGVCAELSVMVPPGAWLIHHPDDDLEHVQVSVYDEYRPGVIQAVGEFEIGTGIFVRIVLGN